jgi:hypothetical protein
MSNRKNSGTTRTSHQNLENEVGTPRQKQLGTWLMDAVSTVIPPTGFKWTHVRSVECTVPPTLAVSLSYRHSLVSSSVHFMCQAVFVKL